MAEGSGRRIWTGRALFLGLACLIHFFQLLPLETTPRSWGAPDFLLLFALAWSARRPDFVPAILIAAVFLVSDLLLHRPPGLWAALVVILSEILRARAIALRVVPFPLEWAGIAAGIVAITLLYRLGLAIVGTPAPPFGLTLVQMLITVVAYPFVVLASYLVFGVSRPAQGEVDAMGRRM